MTENAEQKLNAELVWGAAAIAKVIRRSERSTFHMLDAGLLPAKKVGDRWVADKGRLIGFLRGDAA